MNILPTLRRRAQDERLKSLARDDRPGDGRKSPLVRQNDLPSERLQSLVRISILFLSLALLAGCGRKAPEAGSNGAPKPAPVIQVVPVTFGTLERMLPVTGTLMALPTQEAVISPPVNGVLDGLFIRYGQRVGKGQVIAHLATQQLMGQIQQAQATIQQNQVQVSQAQANALQQQAQTRSAIAQALSAVRREQATLGGDQATLAQDEAAALNAQQNLTREQTLFKDGLVAQKDVQAAQLAVNTAQAQVAAQRNTVEAQRQTIASQQEAVAAARAAQIQDIVKQKDVLVARQQVRNARGALATAQAQMALYTLRAPLAGQITAVGATVGETVDTTTKIATIANLDTLQLQIALPADAARQAHPGQTLYFAGSNLAGENFRTVISSISPQVDAATGTIPALALVANPSHRLKDDITARVQIVTERRVGVLIAPKAAILTDPDTGKTSAVTVRADGVAHVVPVSLGLAVSGWVEIKKGLNPGQRVAVAGQYGLPDGTPVRVQNVPAPAPPLPPAAQDVQPSGGASHGP